MDCLCSGSKWGKHAALLPRRLGEPRADGGNGLAITKGMTSWTPGSPEIRALWALDPAVTYLNHGSFGATPRSVLAVQARLRDEMERSPVEFLARSWPERIGSVRQRVARFVGADPAGLAFVRNATAGVETILGAFDWQAGDEIVFGDHGYNAVRQAIRRLEDAVGVKFVAAKIPFPLNSASEVTQVFANAITPKTRLVVVDHITSPTALILPIEAIIALCRDRNVAVAVDGAHAPGMLALDLDRLGADFYTGNLHKWLCAPKGAAILYVSRARRQKLHPKVISHGYQLGFHAEFDWTGTDDPTSWLAVPAAIDHADLLGTSTLRAANHALVRAGRVQIATALGVALPHPDDPALYGSMATIPFPFVSQQDGPRLNAELYETHKIEVPFTGYDGRCFVRISGQAYNAPEEYERLAKVLVAYR